MDFSVFIPYVAMMTFSPGPNNIICMTTAGKRGFKAAMRFSLGVFIGFFGICVVASVFSALLFDILPEVKSYMSYIGAAYMLYLAYTVFRNKPKTEKKSILQPEGTLSGALFQFLNPKGILYAITTMSTFILPHYDNPLIIGLFALALPAVAMLSNITWALGGSVLDRLFKKHQLLFNIIMAAMLLYCAVMLLLP